MWLQRDVDNDGRAYRRRRVWREPQVRVDVRFAVARHTAVMYNQVVTDDGAHHRRIRK